VDINKMEWPLSKEELEYLYWDRNMSQKEIGDLFSRVESVVRYWMNKFDIKTRKQTSKFSISKKKLKELYLNKKMTTIEIANQLNCSNSTIANYLKKYNIKSRKILDNETFLKYKSALLGKNYTVIGKYKGCATPILIKHDKCGFKYKTTLNNIRRCGGRCPVCFESHKINTKIFKERVKKITGSEYTVLGKYKTSLTKIKIRHNKCGKVYKVKPNAFTNGNRCPKCSLNGFSKGEKKINDFLNENNIEKKWQYRFENCKKTRPLPFDFKIKNKPIVIEYNGEQHYEPVEYFGGKEKFQKQQKNDNIKKQYCKENNIKLIEIPYWEKDNIEEILEEELMLD